MKRRTFIIALVSVGAAAAIPIAQYRRKNFLTGDPLMRPNVLAHFCDGGTISDIGKSYRSHVPEENEKKRLRELLMTNKNGSKVNPSGDEAISEMLEKKIEQEFKDGKIVIQKGWVLSKTEARQCALFSLADQ